MSTKDFSGLRKKLEENTKWPLRYMFKFIVPNEENKIETVKSILPTDGKYSYKHTKNLKFVSITCVANMLSSDDIIYITQNASKVEGVMSL